MRYSPNKVLYGNFKMYEVAKSSTAVRLGIDNTPSDKVLEAAREVAEHILQPVRDEFGPVTPSSWFRCEKLERVITRRSFARWVIKHKMEDRKTEDAWAMYFSRKSHPRGAAVDFEIPGINNIRLYDWCKQNLSEYDQLIAEFMKADNPSAGWVHGSYSNHNRMQLIEIN